MTTATTEGFMAAIDSGIAEASPAPAEDTTNDESDTGEETSSEIDASAGAEASGSDDGDGSEGADGSGDAAEDAEASGKAEPEEADADGEKLEGKDGTEGKNGKDGKDAAKDGKPDQPIVKDPVNDPLPNALKKETRERMQSLISAVKTKDSELQKAVVARDEVLGLIMETKTTPEQYGSALNYLKLVNSGDPAQLEQALTIMQKEVEVLAKALGKAVPGVDVLSAHKDLQDAVEMGTISQEHANELAQNRNTAQFRNAIQTQQTQEHRQSTAQQTALSNGRKALNDLETELKASDPQYAQKAAILVDALKPVIGRADPSEWANIWKTAYSQLKLPAPVARVAPKGVPANQPLRAKTPSGGQQKAPASMFDAINDAIASAR